MARKFFNMQLKIDSLREQINELKDENARFKDMVNGQNVRRRNEIKNSNIAIYSNTDLFILEYISSWPEDMTCKQINCVTLYQEYLAWCEGNVEKLLTSTVTRKKFLQIGIDRTHLRYNG